MMTNRVPAAAAAGLLLASVVLGSGLTGCGVQTQESPQLIDPTSVPYNLLDPGSPKPSALNTRPATRPGATLYFVTGNDVLTPAQRSVPGDSVRERAEKLLDHLAGGPTPAEQGHSLRSAIPTEVRLSVANLEGDLVTVDLSGELGSVSAEENTTAVAQIVLSVTSIAEIDRVLLTVNGQHEDGPRGDGTLTGEPLTATDYQKLTIERPGEEREAESARD